MADDHEWILHAVARFEGPLTRYAGKLLGNADRARDVVQDAFLGLCRQPRSRVEPVLAEWLFTVCRNRALDVLEKEQRMSTLTDVQLANQTSTDPPPLDTIEQHETASRVLKMLDALPVAQREVLRLKFQNGFSYEEISRITGKSISNVGVLIHNGIKTIRSQVVEPAATNQAL